VASRTAGHTGEPNDTGFQELAWGRPLIRYVVACAAIAIVMVSLDLVWLGVIAKPLYQQGIGHLMAEQPNFLAGSLFYAIFAIGLIVFAVLPNSAAAGWSRTAAAGALFGLVAYATYDLTNLATLRNWPIGMSLLDMAWGSALSGIAAAAGRFALARCAGRTGAPA
jgi:uncharacterized membrane protein